MISFDEAIAIIGSAARPLRKETVGLAAAVGRVLAAPVIARIDSPRADVSAMDGYAVRGADLSDYPISLTVVGSSYPGAGWEGSLDPGQCVRIFTGAPLPAGADRIVIQEQVQRDGDVAIVDADPGPASWVRPKSKDFRSGDELLPAGRLLDAAALIATAGGDLADVEVNVRPGVALIATGDELVEPGEACASTLAVPDSASLGVCALAEQWGAEVVAHRRAPDDLEQLRSAADEAVATADVIVVIGGASVGERDFAKAMFEPFGLELLFSRVSIRPGKPAWFGRAGGKLVLGLPGNPTSALVTARLLLAPLIAELQGRPCKEALAWEPARLAMPLRECDQRETFHRGVLRAGSVSLVGFQESHAQKALSQADVLLRQAAHSPAVPAGEAIEILRL